MRSDVEGAVGIAQTAVAFDWEWTVEGLARFCREVGWSIRNEYGVIVTTLNITDPHAWASIHQGLLDDWGGRGEDLLYVTVSVSDTPDPSNPETRAALAQRFSQVNERFMEELGPPDALSFDDHDWQDSYWEHPAVFVELGWGAGTVFLSLTNPKYQQLIEYVDSLDDE